MKTLQRSIAVIGPMIFSLGAAGYDSTKTTGLLGVGTQQGAQIVWEVANNRLDAQQDWVPEDGAPPLSIPRACELGLNWLKSKHPEIKAFAVRHIELQTYSQDEGKRGGRWYYHIDYNPIVGGHTLRGEEGTFAAVVLLDGYVVEPSGMQ